MNKNPEIGIKPTTAGVTAASFLAAGVSCGIRYEGRRDLGLLFSRTRGGTAAMVGNTNALKSAPLLVTREAVEGGNVRAAVVNSGVANAATGKQGLEDAYGTQAFAA